MLNQPALMSDVGDRYVVDAEDNYSIHICDPGEYQVIAMPFDEKRNPFGFHYEHPNIARSRTREEEVKHKQHDWRKHTITTHIFVVPRNRILMLPVKTYTYPKVEIGGEEVSLSTGGGTCGHGWTDYIYATTHTGIGPSKSELLAVAGAAVRGTSFEPYLFPDEIENEFYRVHAQDWIVYSVHGERSEDAPSDILQVWACQGGRRTLGPVGATRSFLVPRGEYNGRGFGFVVDLTKYTEVACD